MAVGVVRRHPTLEVIRCLISVCSSSKKGRRMTNDIRRAYFFADVKDDIFVEIPAEAEHGGDKSVCANLREETMSLIPGSSVMFNQLVNVWRRKAIEYYLMNLTS